MTTRYWLILIRVLSLLAVLTSAALLMHYLAPEESGFCGARSGCEAVRKSALVGALPTYTIPALGVAGYLGVFWLTFNPEQRVWLRWSGAFGGIIALGFIVHQAIGIGAFCWMCLTVDGLAIVIAFACVVMTNQRSTVEQWDPLRGWGWALLLGVAINMPTLWLKVKPNESLPSNIAALQDPGVLNVIEFADFECPHCRRLHPIIQANVALLQRPVKLQRFNVPLPFHIYAEDAARAAVCAKAMGKGDEMDERLFGTPLKKDVWFEHAAALGLDAQAFKACLDSDATNETLADHVDLFKSTGARGLPLTYVGPLALHGAPEPAMVREVFIKALEPAPRSVSGPLFVLLAAGVSVAIAFVFRKKPQSPSSERPQGDDPNVATS